MTAAVVQGIKELTIAAGIFGKLADAHDKEAQRIAVTTSSMVSRSDVPVTVQPFSEPAAILRERSIACQQAATALREATTR